MVGEVARQAVAACFLGSFLIVVATVGKGIGKATLVADEPVVLVLSHAPLAGEFGHALRYGGLVIEIPCGSALGALLRFIV